ncbi:SRPBCC family protein [Motilibacter aurantiacus]|uniref:SRPBCC family protein n=1 Tax=Motilibacter aurantiacus TaxID=2714955 RepID=UPI001409F0FC|nr:SRPBCC family protein [Motilibacter aurantiacus]NHC47617.1 SRPBCC family protein [Motilibacter aurantiacus]
MVTVERFTPASPEAVWAVLVDGWAYANWVVGTSAIRDVDRGWPEEGARIHHSVGAWPLTIDDTTHSRRCEPLRLLHLRARGWPLGEADVVLELAPEGDGTRVTMSEDASEGPGRFVPAPLRWASIAPRNKESLRRLARLAENRRP